MPKIMVSLLGERRCYLCLIRYIYLAVPQNLCAGEAGQNEQRVNGICIERIREEDATAGTGCPLARSQGFGSACCCWDAVNELHSLHCVFLRPILRGNGFAAQSPDTGYRTVDYASQFGTEVWRTVFA